jgi:nucleotide-binding universal stress UspA family protein
MSTHSRDGLTRLMMGSFAESLLMISKTPLLITHPGAPKKTINKILFATDLNKTAMGVFRKVLAFAREMETEIVILHVVKHPLEPVIQSGILLLGGGWISSAAHHEKVTEQRESEAKKWHQEALKAGVKVKTIVTPVEGTVTETILSQSQANDCQMIAMAAQSGKLVANWVGSISREVVRSSQCPVWVVRK